MANRELAQPAWHCRILSASGGVVRSSSGIDVPTGHLDEARDDIVLLLSSYTPESALTKPFLGWLRRRARAGTLMGCVDTGAMIFAEAGLLTQNPAAVHFEALRSYKETYADQMFVDRMFDLSDNRCSSAGGVATFDMTLALIARFSGRELAKRVAEILTYRPTEYDGPQQRMLAETSLVQLDRTLGRAVDLMLANLSDPLSISTLSSQLSVPQWTLERLFKRHLKMTPSAYFRFLRLSQARNLLLNANYRISEVGSQCGFDNPESFARAYKKQFGETASYTKSSASRTQQ
ncbi:GlxA family transcriptional regulator [Sulfitobacter sp. JL08]|uniref:GlxA family transcriptional regulator n=1 Tax=Sulfitobacter sp. JL08 TaxID=2070369 RepID=UPI0013B372E5|nr:helix-turn-helix domain-containing protein [Sulfitobacter sp. JL08]